MSTHYNMGTQDFHPSFLDYTPLLVCDFTTLAPGLASTLFGLSHTRASAATVQTGTSTIFSSLLVDQAGIGRALDADPAALVIDEARTNLFPYSRDMVTIKSNSTVTPNVGSPDGTGLGDRTQTAAGVVGAYYPIGAGANVNVCSSMWVAAPAGVTTQAWQVEWNDAGGTGGVSAGEVIVIGAAWQRRVLKAFSSTAGTMYLVCQEGRNAYAIPSANTCDAIIDFVQGEVGKFATEAIVTSGAAATRAGARLWHPSLNQIMTGGRLSMRAILQAKGATTDYATSPYLWFANASNYATISNSTGAVTLVINGASYTTAGGVTWAQGDVLDIRIMAGGGVSNSVVKIGKNGGALTTLGTSPAPQAAIPAGLALDLLQDSTAANVLSSRLRTLSFYRPGALEVLP